MTRADRDAAVAGDAPERQPSIDVLRAIAIALMVVVHFAENLSGWYGDGGNAFAGVHRTWWLPTGFAAPTFSESLQVVSQRLVGQGHLSLKLRHQGQDVDGIWFGRTEPLPETARLVYRLDVDDWQGQRRVRFVIEAAEP